ncbi:MAG: hypothetical protein Q7J15_00560 [Candidatus Desulfaltia sp.]|nr:hypothetical protein [Candidatus Desulfaltia sp.]
MKLKHRATGGGSHAKIRGFKWGYTPPKFTERTVMQMANGHGGARVGAGQKKKALADKILDGNPGKRKLTVMEFTDTADLEGLTMPPPREYLSANQKSGSIITLS